MVGVGGGGVSANQPHDRARPQGRGFIAINTDAQALLMSDADVKLDVGRDPGDLGAGADPGGPARPLRTPRTDRGAAARRRHGVRHRRRGGGTGTGSAPVVATIARKLGALTVGVVTRHVLVRGKRRSKRRPIGHPVAARGCDPVVIPNDRLLQMGDAGVADGRVPPAPTVLLSGVQGITDLITHARLINVDFADVKGVIARRAGTAP